MAGESPYAPNGRVCMQSIIYGAGMAIAAYKTPWADPNPFAVTLGHSSLTVYPLSSLAIPQYIVMIGPHGQTIAISGTTNLAQALAQMPTSGMLNSTDLQGTATGLVELAARVIYGAVVGVLDRAKPIFLCGHSLGGAVANLLAQKLIVNHWSVSTIYTFASPAWSDDTLFNSYPMDALNIDCAGDVIPYLPPSWLEGYNFPGTNQPIYPGGIRRPGRGFTFPAPVFASILPPDPVWNLFTLGAPLDFVTRISAGAYLRHGIAAYFNVFWGLVTESVKFNAAPMATALINAGLNPLPE